MQVDNRGVDLARLPGVYAYMHLYYIIVLTYFYCRANLVLLFSYMGDKSKHDVNVSTLWC